MATKTKAAGTGDAQVQAAIAKAISAVEAELVKTRRGLAEADARFPDELDSEKRSAAAIGVIKGHFSNCNAAFATLPEDTLKLLAAGIEKLLEATFSSEMEAGQRIPISEIEKRIMTSSGFTLLEKRVAVSWVNGAELDDIMEAHQERLRYYATFRQQLAKYGLDPQSLGKLTAELRSIPGVSLAGWGVINDEEELKRTAKNPGTLPIIISSDKKGAAYGMQVNISEESEEARRAIDAALRPLGIPYAIGIFGPLKLSIRME